MKCRDVEEKLLDYIDRELNNTEEKDIEIHLQNCSECSDEYERIKSTVEYLVNNSNKIDTNKDLGLNQKIYKGKTVRKITRTGLIAVVLSLIFVVTGFATDMFGFMKWWKRSSEKQISAWEKLIENGVGQKLDISTIDKDIKVTAKGVIADELNTIILLEIKDLKGNTRFTPSWRGVDYPGPVVVEGDILRDREELFPIVNSSNIYTEDDNTLNLILKTEPMNEESGEINIHINKLMSMINKDEESIVYVDGSWSIEIPAKKLKSKTYTVNKSIDLDGSELIIEEIMLAPTATNIRYRYKRYNDEKKYFIDDITFLIKDRLKTYNRAEFSFGGKIEEYNGSTFGYSRKDFHIQSLYLVDPDEIDLIVDTYRYTIRDVQKYDIDWDNLPQTIEYRDSKITVEDIKYNDDVTEVTIREDESRNREYINSIIYLKKGVQIELDDNGKAIYLNRDYGSSTRYTEYETRDENGKVKDLEEKFWTDDMHNFIFKQKLIISEDKFSGPAPKHHYPDDFLIPDKLTIEGQEYIKFPNVKLNIKLK